jgi:hypothetical protein
MKPINYRFDVTLGTNKRLTKGKYYGSCTS